MFDKVRRLCDITPELDDENFFENIFADPLHNHAVCASAHMAALHYSVARARRGRLQPARPVLT
jgi:hypothetical protein